VFDDDDRQVSVAGDRVLHAEHDDRLVEDDELEWQLWAERTQASIFGQATINGAGFYSYEIDVVDNGEPGSNDHYRMGLSNGYDSGDHT
jgi:hypothetical protein